MVTVIQVQILYDAVCILHSAATLGKSTNPTILLLAMGKKTLDKLGSLTLVWKLIMEKEKSVFKPVKLHLKIDPVLFLSWLCG